MCRQVTSGISTKPILIHNGMDALTEKVRKEVPESMMFADDVVLCGGNEVDMIEYLRGIEKSAGRERNESQ